MFVQKREVLEGELKPEENAEDFRPPEWLSDPIPRKTPYFPQMGDRCGVLHVCRSRCMSTVFAFH